MRSQVLTKTPKIAKNTTTARTVGVLLSACDAAGIVLTGCGYQVCREQCAQHKVPVSILARRIIVKVKDYGSGLVEISVEPHMVRDKHPKAIIQDPIVFRRTYVELSHKSSYITSTRTKRSVRGISYAVFVFVALEYIATNCAVEVKPIERGPGRSETKVYIRMVRGETIQKLAASRVEQGNYAFRMVTINPLCKYGDLLYPSFKKNRSRSGLLLPSVVHPLKASVYANNTSRDAESLSRQVTELYTRKPKCLPENSDLSYGILATYKGIWDATLNDDCISSRPFSPPDLSRLTAGLKPEKTTVVPTQPGITDRAHSMDAELSAFIRDLADLSVGYIGNYMAGLSYKSEVAGVQSSTIQIETKPRRNALRIDLEETVKQTISIVVHPKDRVDADNFTIPVDIQPGDTHANIALPASYLNKDLVVTIYRRMHETANPELSELLNGKELKMTLVQAITKSKPKTVTILPETRICGVRGCQGPSHTHIPHVGYCLCPTHYSRLRNNAVEIVSDTIRSIKTWDMVFKQPQYERAKFEDGRIKLRPRMIILSSSVTLMQGCLIREEQDRIKGYGPFATGSSDPATRLVVEHDAYSDGRVGHADDNSQQDQTLVKALEKLNIIFSAICSRPDPESMEYGLWLDHTVMSIVASTELMVPFDKTTAVKLDMNCSGSVTTTPTNSKDTAIKQAAFVHHQFRKESDPVTKKLLEDVLEIRPRVFKAARVVYDKRLLAELSEMEGDYHIPQSKSRRYAYLRKYRDAVKILEHDYRDFTLTRPGFGRLVVGDDKTFSFQNDPENRLKRVLGQNSWAEYSKSLGMKIKPGTLYQGTTNIDAGRSCWTCPTASPQPTPRSFKMFGMAYVLCRSYFSGSKDMPYVLLHSKVFDSSRSIIRDAKSRDRFKRVAEETEMVSEFFRVAARASLFDPTLQPYYHDLWDKQALALSDRLQQDGIDKNNTEIWSSEVYETLKYKTISERYIRGPQSRVPVSFTTTDAILAREAKILRIMKDPEPPKRDTPETIERHFGYNAADQERANLSLTLIYRTLADTRRGPA